jgi:hypothetical protein
MTEHDDNQREGKGQDKSFTITVNAREKVVTERELSFEAIVRLAFPTPAGQNMTYTVTYRRGEGNKPAGTLVEGETVRIKEGMIFNVTATDQS